MRVLLTMRVLVPAVLFASAAFVHFRGRVRFPFFRQVLDHSTFMAPINVLVYLFSGVRSTRFLDPAEFPELRVLQEEWRTIEAEASALLVADGLCEREAKRDDMAFNSFFKRGWRRFYVKWYGPPLPSARRLCPRTVALVESIPSINGAMFALLPPAGELGLHRDPYAGSVRYHLGLATPNSDDCYIDIDGERYAWRDGEAVLFDETYMHRARNDTDQDRLIFFADVARPMRGPVSTRLNRSICKVIGKLTASPNVDGDATGSLNRVFGFAYKLHEWTRPLKQRNRFVYRLVKNTLIVALLVAVLVVAIL